MVASPFDPTTWWPWSARPASDQQWLDTWLELTTWWTQPARGLVGRPRVDSTSVLIELVEGIARRFETQRFDATVRSTAVSGTLVALRLVRSEQVDARIELRDLTLAGLPIEGLTAAASSVGLQVGGEVRLSAQCTAVHLRIDAGELLGWVGPQIPSGWSATIDPAGDVWATPSARDLDLLVEPAVRDGSVDLVVRAVRWRGRHVRLPRWIAPVRTIMPTLPAGIRLVGGFRSGSFVEVELDVPAVDERLDLAELRDAIARRQVLAIGE